MFAEVKKMLQNRISGASYDEQIILWIKAAVLDLQMEQIVLDGVCDIERTQDAQTGIWTITDNSTIEDEYVFAACAAYCSMNIGNPPNHENLLKTYNTIKGNMRMSKKYKGETGDEEAG